MRKAVAFVLAASLGGCTPQTSSPAPSQAASTQSAPRGTGDTLLSLGRVAQQAMLQFQREPTGYSGGPTNYLVHVRDSGRFTVQPVQHERRAALRTGAARVRRAKTTTRPLEFETVAMGRDVVAAVAGNATVAGEEIRVERGGVTEIMRNTDGGMEHSWRFAERPAGSADLVVEVSAAGAPMMDTAMALASWR